MTKLILFPYAGSLGLGYNQWMKSLNTKFNVYRINYTELKPEVREYDCKDWKELCDLLFDKVRNIVTDGNYILFGHSMGSRAVYEMYCRIVENQLPLPKKMLFSGCKALTECTKDPSLVSEKEFREEYIELGGISDEVLACQELADLAFEDLRKDVKLLSGFQYRPVSIQCPVTVLNGSQDKCSPREEWEELFHTNVDWKLYEGKHFFIYDHQDEILEELFSFV